MHQGLFLFVTKGALGSLNPNSELYDLVLTFISVRFSE